MNKENEISKEANSYNTNTKVLTREKEQLRTSKRKRIQKDFGLDFQLTIQREIL